MRAPDGIRIEPTEELEAVRQLGLECGLEDTKHDDEDILAAWGAYHGKLLVGAVVLERLGGLYVPNWLSVRERYRRRGVASVLYAALEDEARARGVSRLWVTARAPAFFTAQGFTLAKRGRERDILLGGCLHCPQYGRECEPQALTKTIDDDLSV